MKTKHLSIVLWLYVIGTITLSAQALPSQLWQDTTLLYQSWDTALDTSSYTSAEKNRQKQINERLGHEWVLSYYPIHDAQEFGDLNRTLSPQERHIDFEDITPYTWKWILLRTPEGCIHMRRPNWWLKLHQVEKGKPLALSMPEMQLNVVGEVEQILPNLLDSRFPPAPRDGDYAWLPITAWMERMAPEVWSYVFSSGDTIKATPNHPVFSKDRSEFVAFRDLKLGESIISENTDTVLLVSKQKVFNLFLVNNIEVWRGHTYLIGENEFLVHNSCVGKFLGIPENGQTYLELRRQEFLKIQDKFDEIDQGVTSVVYLRAERISGLPYYGKASRKAGNKGNYNALETYLSRYGGEYEEAAKGLRLVMVVPKAYEEAIERIIRLKQIEKYGAKTLGSTQDTGASLSDDIKIAAKTWLEANHPEWDKIWDLRANGF